MKKKKHFEIVYPITNKIPKDILKIKDNLKELRHKELFGYGYISIYYSGNHYVYFLIDGDEVVYVGETADIYTRPFSHKNDKKFNYVYFLEVENKTRALVVEKYWQLKILPKYCNDSYLIQPKQNKAKKIKAYKKKLENLYAEKWDKFLSSFTLNFLTSDKYKERIANIQYKKEKDKWHIQAT